MDKLEEGARFLPPRLRQRVLCFAPDRRRQARELRLRVGQEPTAVCGNEEIPFPGEGRVTAEELALLLEIATQASPQAMSEQIRQGYLTLAGGHRLGLCGSAWAKEGQVRNIRRLSSVNLRLAREVPNCGRSVLGELIADGGFCGTLIVAPPGGGKTTLLRDVIRLLSDGTLMPPMRVGLCDERGEVAALREGIPQFEVGAHTDILEGCPKAEGLLMLLRTMTPQILACDEITRPDDVNALEICGNFGAVLLATVHGRSVNDLWEKPLYRTMLERKLFRRAVVADGRNDFHYQVEVLE